MQQQKATLRKIEQKPWHKTINSKGKHMLKVYFFNMLSQLSLHHSSISSIPTSILVLILYTQQIESIFHSIPFSYLFIWRKICLLSTASGTGSAIAASKSCLATKLILSPLLLQDFFEVFLISDTILKPIQLYAKTERFLLFPIQSLLQYIDLYGKIYSHHM